jgi:opacity protein-like surface antigen
MSVSTDMALVRGWLARCILIAMLTSEPAAADALDWEWYVGAFAGAAFPTSDDVKIRRSVTETDTSTFFPPVTFGLTETITARGASFDASPVVGAKAGVCPGFFPYLCAELGFGYVRPTLGAQTTAGTTSAVFTIDGSPVDQSSSNVAQVSRVDLNVWDLGLNLIGRFGVLPEPDYPLGKRLHLYLGAGPSVVWTQAKNVCTGFSGAPGEVCGGKDTDTTIGVQALAGVRVFITKNLAIFGEYQFKHWAADFSFSSATSQTFGPDLQTTQQAQTKITDVDFNIQMFSIGLSFHF